MRDHIRRLFEDNINEILGLPANVKPHLYWVAALGGYKVSYSIFLSQMGEGELSYTHTTNNNWILLSSTFIKTEADTAYSVSFLVIGNAMTRAVERFDTTPKNYIRA